jgi:pimeloyl-ACP methyl ester carboxylesterase
VVHNHRISRTKKKEEKKLLWPNTPTYHSPPFIAFRGTAQPSSTAKRGPADAPVVLLLHGFPTSSFQYRELIPRLADTYRVIAPDLPGFGFTEVPAARNYK